MRHDIERVWQRIVKSEGKNVRRKNGEPFTYVVKTDVAIEVIGISAGRIYKQEFEKALAVWPVSNTTALPDDIHAKTYIWAILNDLDVVGRDPETLKHVSAAAARWRAASGERDATIDAANAAGYSIREIAAAAELSHGAISKILLKGKEADE